MVEAINTTNRDELWDQFNKFYNKNEKVIERCMKTDVRSIVLSEKVSDIEVQTDTFSATTKIVLDGLAGLEKIYPIIEGACRHGETCIHALLTLFFVLILQLPWSPFVGSYHWTCHGRDATMTRK
jgi:hypothetical protein